MNQVGTDHFGRATFRRFPALSAHTHSKMNAYIFVKTFSATDRRGASSFVQQSHFQSHPAAAASASDSRRQSSTSVAWMRPSEWCWSRPNGVGEGRHDAGVQAVGFVAARDRRPNAAHRRRARNRSKQPICCSSMFAPRGYDRTTRQPYYFA